MSYEHKDELRSMIAYAYIDEVQEAVARDREIKEVYQKSEAFDECVNILSVCKTSANPHDILKAYDEIGEIFQPYIFNKEGPQ